MMNNQDPDTDRIERNRILAELDVDAALSWVPGLSREGILAGMHKARYECPDIAPELRHASGEWLRCMGFSRLRGLPLLPLGELPE